MTEFGVQLHGTFPMPAYPGLARAVERHPFRELTVHDVVWWRPAWPILREPHRAARHRAGVPGPGVRAGRGGPAPPRGELLLAAGAAPGAGFVGAFGPRMLQLACAGWADQVRPPGIWDVRFSQDVKRRVGGRVELGCEVWTVLDRDRERARDLGREVLARFLPAMGAMTAFYGVDPQERPIRDRTLDLFVAAAPPGPLRGPGTRAGRRGPRGPACGGRRGGDGHVSGRLGADPHRAIDALGDVVASR